MSKRSQVIEIIRLVTLLMGGLGAASAIAQAPTFSAPTLPTIPGSPGAPPSPSSVVPTGQTLVPLPAAETSIVPPPNTPALSDLTKAPIMPVTAPATQPTDDALADLPAPRPVVTTAPAAAPSNPEAGDVLSNAPASNSAAPSGLITVGAAPAANLAPPLPAPDTLAPPPLALAPPPLPAVSQTTSLPEVDVPSDSASAAPKPVEKKKTWLTKLAPSDIPPKTNFNYKREILPPTIYRTRYDRENSHLPVRMTKGDYERMLVATAASNDINGTRALLNAGTDINAAAGSGMTPLMAARRAGAVDTAHLLLARGAH